MLYPGAGYLGGTDVEDGTLSVGGDSAVGPGSLTVNGGKVNLNAFNIEVSSLSGTGGIITGDGGSTLTVDGATSTTYAGDIEGGLALSATGGGTLTLQGNNTFSGGVDASGATVDSTGNLGGDVNASDGGHVYQPPADNELSFSSFYSSSSYPNPTGSGDPVNGYEGGLAADGTRDGTGNFSVVVTGTIAGAPTGSIVQLDVNWGDGDDDNCSVVAGSPFTMSHVYDQLDPDQEQQTFDVDCTATASDGRTASSTTQVRVEAPGLTLNVGNDGGDTIRNARRSRNCDVPVQRGQPASFRDYPSRRQRFTGGNLYVQYRRPTERHIGQREFVWRRADQRRNTRITEERFSTIPAAVPANCR